MSAPVVSRRSEEQTGQQTAGEGSQQQNFSGPSPIHTEAEDSIDESGSGNPHEQPAGCTGTDTTTTDTSTTIATNGEPLIESAPPRRASRRKPLRIKKTVSFADDDEEGVVDMDNLQGSGQQEQDPQDMENEQGEVQVVATMGGAPRHEYAFVLCAGVFMAFNSGYVNGSCLSGFVVPSGRKFAVSSFTQTITLSGLELARGNYDQFGFLACMFLSFMFGSFISGILSPDPTPFRIEPMYGPSFLIGAAFLVVSSILAALEINENFVFYLAAAANGIQNGISSIYSENLIRSTGHSGATTDISLFIAQICRGNTKNKGRLLVLVSLLVAFWSGGVVSFWSAQRYTSFSLLINAGLFVLAGLGLVLYLIYELGISVQEAFLGNWRWKNAIGILQKSFDNNNDSSEALNDATSEEQLNKIFDKLDTDKSGEIDAMELLQGLQEMGVTITEKECEAMLQHADTDGNGSLSREEWLQVARACQRKRYKDIKKYSWRHMHLRESTGSR